jgi:hypothetical protein
MDELGIRESRVGAQDIAAWEAWLADKGAVRGDHHELLDPGVCQDVGWEESCEGDCADEGIETRHAVCDPML